jgi:hypothetical protein
MDIFRRNCRARIDPRMPQPNTEFDAFTKTMDKLLTVSPEELKRRLAAHKEQADKNPRKRGPKKRTEKASSTPSG